MKIWEWALSFLTTCFNAAFQFFDRILSALPGAWATILTLIVILTIQRFLLVPLGFGSVSDTVSNIVKKGRSDKSRSSKRGTNNSASHGSLDHASNKVS